MKCARAGCKLEAKFIPIAELRCTEGGVPAASEVVDLCVCPRHMEETTLDDIFTDNAWANIKATFEKFGYAIPQKEFSTLKFKQIKII